MMKGNIITDHPHRTVWELTGGLKIGYSVIYVEGRAGYFSSFNKFGYVPAVGLRLGNIDIQGNYTFVGDDEYIAVRLAYYWADN